MTIHFKQLQTLTKLCQTVMRCDQYSLQQRLRELKNRLKIGKPIEIADFEQLTADIEKSSQRCQQRAAQLPIPQFPDNLPVSEYRTRIAEAIAANPIVIIAGETGSGKTTQLPKICLTLGRGVMGMIGCTQPRRIAARTVASRVASELQSEVGHAVGYQVRFNERLSRDTYIKFMTDGILLAETQNDRFLNNYDTLIIDEAHERSLNIDFLLGYLKQLLPKRPDLKLIITSATIDTERFSTHFDNAPVIQISARTYPVEVRYRPLLSEEDEITDRDIQQAILDATDEIALHDKQGDILVFLSGEREIRETAESLRKHHPPNTEILPLYARLSAAEQNRVFLPSNKRRIVLATNVAETSLTVPGIKAVIDPGLARISRYSIRSKVQRLPIEKISRSSADQRKGRCGRIAPGLCIRLYSEEDYQNRSEFTDPEILRTSLASVILQMLAFRLGDIDEFPFLEPPESKMINDGFTLLIELGAVNEKRDLTEIGQQLAKLPIDPRLGRMILAAKQENCLQEVLIIASALSIQDPRERPLDMQATADLAQSRFMDENSDFIGFLKLWAFFQEQAQHLSKNKLRKLCQEHFLSYLRMREWEDVHQQLYTLIKELNWQINQIPAEYDAIHRALLAGLLGNVGFKTETEQYLGARNIKLFLFPGSRLYKKPPKWIMAAELVETTRLYARCVAKITPEWIEQVAGKLCQHHYFEPHWEKRVAEVAGYERVTLYGLTIVPKRKINYGALDPVLSRKIFIRHALVLSDYHSNAPFFNHNRQLVNEIEALEHRARRPDILVDEEQIYHFYESRIPQGIYNGKAFEQWRKQAERKQPKLLFLTREDLMQHAGDSITQQAFPDSLCINGVNLPLTYHFEPGHARDGVTVTIPLTLLNQLYPQPFEWLVPGLLEEKIIALLRSLPKALRKAFVPVPDVARLALKTITLSQDSLYEVLAAYCQQYADISMNSKLFSVETLPPYLCMNFLLLDADNQFLDMERDLSHLQQRWSTHASTECRQKVANSSGLEKNNLTTWNFGELPAQVNLQINGITVQGFPTLIDQNTHVDLRVLDNQATAQRQLRDGLRRLFWLSLPTKKLLKQLPINHKLCLQYVKLGNSDELKNDILMAVIDTLFLADPLPMNQAEFEQRLTRGQQQLVTLTTDYVTLLTDILAEYTALTQQLANIADNPTVFEIKQHLATLVYMGFIKEIPLIYLKHLPRYVKAIRLRVEKLARDPNKDKQKSLQINPLWQAYLQYRQQHSLNPQLVEFRWLLEELRVSLFAQELKTACSVSVQRLEKLWKSINN